MRVWLLVLLMLLLPLRGWSASVMQVAHGSAPLVTHAPVKAQAATPHCHDTAAPAEATPASPDHRLACQACDLCHGAWLTQTVTPALGMPRLVLQPIPRVAFASTVVVPHHKPPIA
jgi:hypothetical protein